MHQNARLHSHIYNNSHLITPSRSLNWCGATTKRASVTNKITAHRKKFGERVHTKKKGKYVRKQTTNMNQELKLNFINALRIVAVKRNTHTHTHSTCLYHHDHGTYTNMHFGVALLHNRSHLSILFACHIPFMLENHTLNRGRKTAVKCLLVFPSQNRTNQTINTSIFFAKLIFFTEQIHTHLLIHLI